MVSLQQIVEQHDTRWGRAFDLTIQALIILSLVTFSIGTLPNKSPATVAVLEAIELVTVAIFTIEYLLRVYLAEHKLKFIFSFFGIIDLLAVLPFYLSPTLDLRPVRTFRLLRLIRILKLARYSKAIRRFHRALLIAREELLLFLSVSLILFFLAAVGIYHCENLAQPEKFASVFHSMWWSMVTLSTVGYGDIYPVTVGGRIFTFFVLLVGVSVITIPAGIVATALSRARQLEDEADEHPRPADRDSAGTPPVP